MRTREVEIKRISTVSTRSFDDVVGSLTATIGRPDMNEFREGVSRTRTMPELEALVANAVGTSGLMEFVRFDAGAIVRKGRDETGRPKILRFVVGNPLVMKEMVKMVPDAAAYAPVTILVDERTDGVHISYDSMASLIAPYGSEAALSVARQLDGKIESLLEAAARGGDGDV